MDWTPLIQPPHPKDPWIRGLETCVLSMAAETLAKHFPSPSLSLLICKMVIILISAVVLTSRGSEVDQKRLEVRS